MMDAAVLNVVVRCGNIQNSKEQQYDALSFGDFSIHPATIFLLSFALVGVLLWCWEFICLWWLFSMDKSSFLHVTQFTQHIV